MSGLGLEEGVREAPWVQDGKAGVQSLVCHQPGAAGWGAVGVSYSAFLCLSSLHLS